MPHRTTHTNLNKPFNQPFTRIRLGLLSLTQRLFAASDSTARQHGWDVNFFRRGFGRQYRDPRFDTLASCGNCRGYGVMPTGNTCERCNGYGRIILKPDAEPPSSPPKGLA